MSGCGYVFASWADDNNETCRDIYYYSITSRRSVHTTVSRVNVTVTIGLCCLESNTFEPIQNDAQVDISIYKYIPPDDDVPIGNVANTSLRTLVFESMCIKIYR